MKDNEAYIKSITPEESWGTGGTDFWYYDEKKGRDWTLDRGKYYIIPASYIKYAGIGYSVESGNYNHIGPREIPALDDFSSDKDFLRLQYIGGDRFLEPVTGEILFISKLNFSPYPNSHSVIESEISSEFNNLLQYNPLFVQSTPAPINRFKIFEYESREDMEKVVINNIHVLTEEEVKSSFSKAKQTNETYLTNLYSKILEQQEEYRKKLHDEVVMPAEEQYEKYGQQSRSR